MTLPDAPEQPVPVPSLDALKALLAECGEDHRDTAIIRLFVDTGCRRGELAPLQVDDVDFTENTVTVLGKGRRPRTVPLETRPAPHCVATSESEPATRRP